MTRQLYYHLRKYEGKALVKIGQLCVEVECKDRELLHVVAARSWPVAQKWAEEMGGISKYPNLVPAKKTEITKDCKLDTRKA
jgi:hypothetical protein